MRYELFVWLVFAHVVGDIALENSWLAENKGKYKICMLWHSIIWTGCICLMVDVLGVELPGWKIAFLLSGHYGID